MKKLIIMAVTIAFLSPLVFIQTASSECAPQFRKANKAAAAKNVKRRNTSKTSATAANKLKANNATKLKKGTANERLKTKGSVNE